jgi:cytochrome c oxidase subunit 4
MSHAQPAEHAVEEHGLSVRTYLMIGAGLTVITLIELGISYSGMANNIMIPLLLVLSAFKFVVVVAYFMHLRFDSSLFTKMFVGSLLLMIAIICALLTLFWWDSHTIPLG